MSERFVHQAPCGACRGELELWHCPPCGRTFSWCRACRLARDDAADPMAAGVRQPARACPAGHGDKPRPPSLEELGSEGLASIAAPAVGAPPAARRRRPASSSAARAALPPKASGLEADGADLDAQDGREAARRLWYLYASVALFAIFVLGEDGADVGVPFLLLGGGVAAMIAVGWPAWPRFVRDPIAIGLAIAATGLTLAVFGWAAAAGGPGEFLRAPWRWGLLFGGMAAVCAAYTRAPEAVPRWLADLAERAWTRN